MRKIIVLSLYLTISLYAKNLVECNEIFEQRKSEILRAMDRLDDQQQSFELYKEAQNNLLEKREKKITKKLQEVNATLQKVEKTKKEVVKLYQEKKHLLEEIKKAKDDKITAAYLKMKDSKAASILDDMPKSRAAKILFNLTPKKISKVMAKMDPIIASDVTELLLKGPPFDNNLTKR